MKKGIKELFIEELQDVLSCETQILKALPKMILAAESSELKNAFRSHLKETTGQVKRLHRIFKILNLKEKKTLCKGTKGLIQECQDAIKDFDKSSLRDAALIAKAQRIEHYEIATYGTLRTFANELGLKEVPGLLQETLVEEANADKKLTKIAEGGLFKTGVNQKAISSAIAKLNVAKKTSPKRKKTLSTAKKKIQTKAKSKSAKSTTAKKSAHRRTLKTKTAKRKPALSKARTKSLSSRAKSMLAHKKQAGLSRHHNTSKRAHLYAGRH